MAEIRNRPLSYIDWIQSQALASLSESDLFDRYNEYVVDFYKAAKTKNIDNAVAIEQLYVDLLQEITLNYTSHEERRFLSQLDYTDKKDFWNDHPKTNDMDKTSVAAGKVESTNTVLDAGGKSVTRTIVFVDENAFNNYLTEITTLASSLGVVEDELNYIKI